METTYELYHKRKMERYRNWPQALKSMILRLFLSFVYPFTDRGNMVANKYDQQPNGDLGNQNVIN